MKPWALLQKTEQLQTSTISYFHYWKLAWLFQITKITLFLTFDKGFASKLRVKTRHTKCVDPTLPLVVLHSNESNVSRMTSSKYWFNAYNVDSYHWWIFVRGIVCSSPITYGLWGSGCLCILDAGSKKAQVKFSYQTMTDNWFWIVGF